MTHVRSEILAGLPSTHIEWPNGPEMEEGLHREWLVTNGLGGYASGTLLGGNTRRYHGLFVPNLPGRGRMVLLARIAEEVASGGGARVRLDAEEHADGTLLAPGAKHLRAFRLWGLLPEWEFEIGRSRMRRRIVMVHGENTVIVAYELLSGPELELRLRPFVVYRFHELPSGEFGEAPVVRIQGPRIELRASPEAPWLRIQAGSDCAVPFVSLRTQSPRLLYRVERNRELDHFEVQESPGYFECLLTSQRALTIAATVEPWEVFQGEMADRFDLELEREKKLLEHAKSRTAESVAARLTLAADQFIMDPVGRPSDEAWARATGQSARSVIAGFHWFADWGRDTMISLEGLALLTGRTREAASILRTFQHYVQNGLIPNLFPEGNRAGLYHTADATLWYFHAIGRYLAATGDLLLLRDLFGTLEEIVSRHTQGTLFGIGVDPADGLLRQGAEGYQLTWMDAKVEGWVVTPRRGKTVEINALWYHALSLMSAWAQQLGQDPSRYGDLARRTYDSFNRRFWNEKEGCLFDVVDGERGDDPAIRPNQIFAVSLPHAVLRPDRWKPVLERVRQELLTPFGMRTLSPRHPDYRSHYDGDLRARDAAYHQGTVWPWLIGHFIDAWLKVRSDRTEARGLLSGLEESLHDICIGQLGEIFDATEPFRPRGAVAQAWSVAEFFRAWVNTRDA